MRPQTIAQYHIISTHTSRVGCDSDIEITKQNIAISTHTSRVGCDSGSGLHLYFVFEFLLTHPVWDVTEGIYYNWIEKIFLLTHPVWDVTAIYSIFQSHYSHILQDGPIIHLELY